MLETIDSVPWRKLRHAYGDASDVPGLIRMLTCSKKEEREEAVHELFGNIYHQGTIYEATEYAVPFLVELLEAQKTKCKEGILSLLQGFILGVDFLEVDDRLVLDEDCERRPRTAYQELVYRVYLAICKGVASYMALLEDRSPRTRAGAVCLLGCCAGKRKDLYALIRTHFATETSPMVRATCVFAVGLLKRANRSNLKWLKGMLESKDRTLRLWAAIGLARCTPDALPDAAYAAIHDGILSSDSYEKSKSCVHLACAETVFTCCQTLSSRKQDAAKGVAVLLRALAETPDAWTANCIVPELLGLVFHGKRITKQSAIEHRPMLQAIAESDAFWHVYERHIADSRLERMLKTCTRNGTQKEFKAFLRSLGKETSGPRNKPSGR